jgi:hypothetical protein
MFYKPILEVLFRVAAVCLVAGLVYLTGCEMNFGGGSDPPPAGPTRQRAFTLGVEHRNAEGQWSKIPRDNHVVTLRRAPFRMVFWFDRMGTMLVQASLKPTLYMRAADGAPLDQLRDRNAAIPEDLMNPLQNLVVDDQGAYHNWLYLGPKTHRFDPQGVRQFEQGGAAAGYLCWRTVSRVVLDGRPTDVRNLPVDRLYLVFVKTGSDGSGRRVETARDWVVLKFVD